MKSIRNSHMKSIRNNNSNMETNTTSKTKHDLLYHMEQIVDMAQDSELSKEFFTKAKTHISYVARKLHLTPVQAALMAIFIDRSEDDRILLSEIGNFLACRTTRMLRYQNDIDELERRDLVRGRHRRDSRSYRVPLEVVDAVRHDECYAPRNIAGITCSELFYEVEQIFEDTDNDELTYAATVERINHLLQVNQQLAFTRNLLGYGFDEDENTLLMVFCHRFVNCNDDQIGFHDLSFLYQGTRGFARIRQQLEHGDHIFQQAGIIDFSGEEGIKDRAYFQITATAKEHLFAELNLPTVGQQVKRAGLIKHEDITPKQLFYSDDINRQIQDLAGLLTEEKYQQVCDRLRKQNFRSGFTCLFYGAPGTGKTETALQLARLTGRDIMQVNVAQIKSKWVGESEQNIKALFDRYRKRVKQSKVAPILLFNEADAIIGRRLEGAEHAVEKMENSIQNIILQEMETLDGILIATTNLSQNLDPAFERRFLYKIKFTMPTLQARQSIWSTMLPSLPERVTRTLAEGYDFTGGQIENIARHYAIDSILHGPSDDPLPKLIEHCRAERLQHIGSGSARIGFN